MATPHTQGRRRPWSPDLLGLMPQWPRVSPAALDTAMICGGVAGLVSVLVPSWLAAPLLGAFVLCGPGALVARLVGPLATPLALVSVPALGLSVVTLVASAQLALGGFAPGATTLILAGLCLVAGAVDAVRQSRGAPRGAHETREPPRPDPSVARQATSASVIVTVASICMTAVVAFVSAAVAARGSAWHGYGLLAVVPMAAAGPLLSALALALAVRAGSWRGAWAAVITLAVTVRGLTVAATAEPLYVWTYKHVAVVDWFRYGENLAPDVDVYSSWPGFMALAAWFSESSGLEPLTLAYGFIAGYHLLLLPVLYIVARCARLRPLPAVVATFGFEALAWVGQDYFAPQAFAYLLGLVVLAHLLAGRMEARGVASPVIAIVVFTAVVWSHQLTPVWLLVLAVALTFLRVVQPRWVLIGLGVSYALMLVVNLDMLIANSPGLSLDLLSNAEGNVTAPPGEGQAFTERIIRVVALGVWGSAAVMGLWRWWRLGDGLAMLIIAFGSVVVLGSNYGGEAVFRFYLYSLLGCCLILAPTVTALLRGRLRAWIPAALAVGVVVALATQAWAGGWYIGVVRSHDRALEQRLARAAGERGQVVPMFEGFPSPSTWRYVPQWRADRLTDQVWGVQELYLGTDGRDPGPVEDLTWAVEQRSARDPVYVVFTPPMAWRGEQYGTVPPAAHARIQGHFADNGWPVVYRGDGAVVFGNPAGLRAWRDQGFASTGPTADD